MSSRACYDEGTNDCWKGNPGVNSMFRKECWNVRRGQLLATCKTSFVRAEDVEGTVGNRVCRKRVW